MLILRPVLTQFAVQLRYQVPYMQCGCTLPNESSWRKCMRLVRQHLRSKPYLPTALHRDHIPATHPSIHNAILSSHRKVIELPGWMMSDGGRNHAHTGNVVQVQSYTVRAQGHDTQAQRYGTLAQGDGVKPQGYNVQAPGPQLSRKLSGRGTQPQGHNVPAPGPQLSRKLSGRGTQPQQGHNMQTSGPHLSRKTSGRGTQATPHRSDSARRKHTHGGATMDRKSSGRPADFGYYGRGPVYAY